MEINELKDILKDCYAKDTAHPASQSNWNENNPTLGHCAIVSVIVQEHCGGEIMRTMVNGTSHYFNYINGKVYDLTSEQFGNIDIPYDKAEPRTKEYILSNSDTKQRYDLLVERINKKRSPYVKKI